MNFTRIPVLLWCLLGCCIFLSAQACSRSKDDADVGEVFAVKGEWHANGQSKPLLAGQAVARRSRLEDLHVATGDHLNILLLSGRSILVDCDSQKQTCEEGVVMPDTYLERPGTHDIVKAVGSVLLDREIEVTTSLSPTISRGLEGTNQEAVVECTQRMALPLGELLARLRVSGPPIDELKIQRAENAGNVISKTPIDWEERAKILVEVPGPGPYIIELIRDNDDTAFNVFVLAVTADSYPRIQSAFEAARKITVEWNGTNQDSMRSRFLRAYLLSLASRS